MYWNENQHSNLFFRDRILSQPGACSPGFAYDQSLLLDERIACQGHYAQRGLVLGAPIATVIVIERAQRAVRTEATSRRLKTGEEFLKGFPTRDG